MKTRILRKILKDKSHPKHAALATQTEQMFEAYGRSECKRIGINPDRWGSAALRWPSSLTKKMAMLRR